MIQVHGFNIILIKNILSKFNVNICSKYHFNDEHVTSRNKILIIFEIKWGVFKYKYGNEIVREKYKLH